MRSHFWNRRTEERMNRETEQGTVTENHFIGSSVIRSSVPRFIPSPTWQHRPFKKYHQIKDRISNPPGVGHVSDIVYQYSLQLYYQVTGYYCKTVFKEMNGRTDEQRNRVRNYNWKALHRLFGSSFPRFNRFFDKKNPNLFSFNCKECRGICSYI